jgi:Concanavalin A-like lectin/glucanases superfamily
MALAACDVYDALPPHGNSSGGAGSSGAGGTTGSDGSTAGAGRGGLGAQAGAGPSTGGGGSSTGGTAGTTPGDGAVDGDAPPGDSSVGGAAGATTGGGAGTAGSGGFSGASGSGGLSGAAGTTDGSGAGGSTAGTDGGPSRGGSAGLDAGHVADTNVDNDGRQDVDASLDATPRDGPVDEGAREADVDAGNCAGYAFNFTGATYATLSRPVQDDFTLEAWVKTSSSLAGTLHYQGRALIHGDVVGNANDFGASILNSKFVFGVGNPDTTVQGATTVTTGQWMHVAATRQMSTGEIRVIVNGTMDGSLTPAQTNSLTAASALTLGGNTIDARYFIGYVDELRIWNVVRTPAQISSTMNQRLNGSEPGLVSYFRFDEGSGTVAADSSSRGVNATLNGSPAWVPSDAPICSPTGDP